MQRRINLESKLALAVGTVMLVCLGSYAALQHELGHIRTTLAHSVNASQAMLHAAYEMDHRVGELAARLRRAADTSRPTAGPELADLAAAFEASLEVYLRHADDAATRTLARDSRSRFTAYLRQAESVAALIRQGAAQPPALVEKVAALEQRVHALATHRSSPSEPPVTRVPARELLRLGRAVGTHVREFLIAPTAANAWEIEQASGAFESVLVPALGAQPDTAALVGELRARNRELRAITREEMARRLEIARALGAAEHRRDSLGQFIRARLQGAASAQVAQAQSEVDRRVETARNRVGIMLVVTAVLGMGACWLAVRGFLRPVHRLIAALQGVGRGQLAARIDLDRNDELGDLAGAFNDMSARLESMTVSRAYLDQILSAIAEGVFVVDPAFRVQRANAGALKLAGMPHGQLAGQALPALIRRADGSAWQPGAAGATEFEGSLAAADGSIRPILFSCSPLAASGDSAGLWVCTATDITVLKRVEQALERSHEDLRGAYIALQSVQEEERARLAREVHDEFGAVLTVMNNTLFMLQDALPDAATGGSIMLARLHELVRRASDATDTIVNGLHPPILDHFGLEAALEWYIDDYRQRTALELDVELCSLPELEPAQALAIFRVAQECLTNVTRHAQATHCRIRLGATARQLVLSIEDDGIGCGTANGGGRAGLRGMHERLRSLGGTLTLTTRSGAGTRVDAVLPLPPAVASAAAAHARTPRLARS